MKTTTSSEKTFKEYFQVITKDNVHYFKQCDSFEDATNQKDYLLKSGQPYCDYEYDIIHVIETREVTTLIQ